MAETHSPNATTRPITALISTRNRGACILQAVRSILANNHPNFELVIVDQSDDDATRRALAPFLADPRLRYIATETRGLGRGRNVGIERVSTEIVAITDDDCEVPADWLERIAEAFEEQPSAAVLFYNVEPAPHDAGAGFIPAYVRQGSQLMRRLWETRTSRAIGAGLAVRRQALLEIGGFDDMMGPGAEFRSCEDRDLAARALLLGYHVYETDRVSVIHYGFRSWHEGRDLTKRDWYGIGAAHAKWLRRGRFNAVALSAYEFSIYVLKPILRELVRAGKLRGFQRAASFWHGYIQGLRTPVDRATLRFQTK